MGKVKLYIKSLLLPVVFPTALAVFHCTFLFGYLFLSLGYDKVVLFALVFHFLTQLSVLPLIFIQRFMLCV